MPCRYDPSPAELAQARAEQEEKRNRELNKLTAEADRLREFILKLHADKKISDADLPHEMRVAIEREQVKHRKMDLQRLEATFTKNKDAERLALVWKADPKKPLEPQLGFDPDAF